MNRILTTPILIATLLAVVSAPRCTRARAEQPSVSPAKPAEEVASPSREVPVVPSRPIPARAEQTPRLLPSRSRNPEEHEAVLSRVEQTIRQGVQLRSQRVKDLKDQLEALLLVTANSNAADVVSPDPSPSAPDAGDNAANSDAPAPSLASQAGATLTPLTTLPIDRLALANNLFASGQYGLSLESYKQLNPETMQPGERRWARYQAACCYRKLGNPSQAEPLYRELASEAADDFVGVQARWWLDRIQKRQRLENSLKGLEESLQTLESTIRSDGVSPVPTGTTLPNSPGLGG